MKDFLDNFQWHSSTGFDASVKEKKHFKTKLANSKAVLASFVFAGSNLLIHKATNALWRVSEDKKSIIPVFDTDVLTAEDLEVES